MSTRHCGVDDEALWDMLDQPAAADTDVLQRHVSSCTRCADRLSELSRLHAALESVCRPKGQSTPTRMGSYRILRRIGEGGMGVVYEAEQDQPRRRVAVKVMQRSVGGDRAARLFRREVQALGRLQHVGLVTIHDAGDHDGELYMVMELVEGVSLDRYCQSHALDVHGRVDLCLRVAEAVHHAHDRGVLHLDLKPGNLLVDGDGKPRVLDFGLARFLRATGQAAVSRTMLASPVGTLPYMSPEQLRGADALDARADVYSIGAVLYELLTGAPPFGVSRSLAEALLKLGTPPTPPASCAEVSRALSDVVMQAIEVEREDRYRSVSALAEDLRRWLAGRSVSARPSTLHTRWWRRVRRQPTTRAAAGAVLAAAAAWAFALHPAADDPPRLRTLVDIPELQLESGGGRARAFDVDRDGQRIVHLVGDELRIWDRRKSAADVLGRAADGEIWGLPRWWPRRDAIAIAVQRQDRIGHWEVRCLDVDTGHPREVFSVTGRLRDLCASTGGELWICALDDRIVAHDAESGAQRWHRSSPGEALSLGGVSADGRWLLVGVRSRTDGGVWIIAAGADETAPTLAVPGGRHPTWSADGKHVFYTADSADRSAGNSLWRMPFDAETGRPMQPATQLTHYVDAGVHRPVASRAGVSYAVVRKSRTVLVARDNAFDAASSVIRGANASLSPDGQTILYLAEDPSTPGLHAVPVSGGDPRLLAPDLAGGPGTGPADGAHFCYSYDVSPDGASVAYAARTGTEHSVRIVPVAGGRARIIARTTGPAVPRWSADGHTLAYVDQGALFIAPVNGQAPPRPVGEGHRWHPEIAWSPRTSLLAALRQQPGGSTNRLYLIDPRDGQQVCLTPTEDTYKENLSWHPSGAFCTYVGAANSGRSEVRFAFTSERQSRHAFEQANHWDYGGVWSPDGRSLFFHSFSAEETNAMHIYDLTEQRVIAHGVPGTGDLPRWSVDGSRVVWTVTRAAHTFEILSER